MRYTVSVTLTADAVDVQSAYRTIKRALLVAKSINYLDAEVVDTEPEPEGELNDE